MSRHQIEIDAGTVTIRDLRRQDQFTVPRADVASALRVDLAQPDARLRGRAGKAACATGPAGGDAGA